MHCFPYSCDFIIVNSGRLYANAANTITHINPSSTATIVASTVLITDTQPFIPQAQGIKAVFIFEIRDNPAGNGIPIQNARGAMISKTVNDFKNTVA